MGTWRLALEDLLALVDDGLLPRWLALFASRGDR
jgi:hypothetical protein